MINIANIYTLYVSKIWCLKCFYLCPLYNEIFVNERKNILCFTIALTKSLFPKSLGFVFDYVVQLLISFNLPA